MALFSRSRVGSSQVMSSVSVLAAVFGACASIAPASLAQTVAPAYEAPRTLLGKPDLQGVWSYASVTRLTRPEGYPLVLSREQADVLEGRSLFNQRMKTQASYVDPNEAAPEKGKALPGVGNYDVAYTDPGSTVAHINGELRSSFIVYPENGQIPPLTAEGVALRDAAGSGRRGMGYDNPEERSLYERCVFAGTAGPPLSPTLYNNHIQIVQSPDHMVVMVEMIHDTRITPIGDKNASRRDNRLQPWMGDSIGWWEGDTLVVETANMHPDQRASQRLVVLSDTGKLIERYTRISDDQILYAFEVHDPRVYTETWRAEMPLNRVNENIHEYACSEGNHALVNILSGGREMERRGESYADGDKREE